MSAAARSSYPDAERREQHRAAGCRSPIDLTGDGKTSGPCAVRMFYDNIITAVLDVGRVVNGSPSAVRTLVLAAPRAAIAWNAPGHRLGEDQVLALLGGAYPSLAIVPGPSLRNVCAPDCRRRRSPAARRSGAHRERRLSSRLQHAGDDRLQPGAARAVSVPSRRPNDSPCSANPAATCVNGGIPGTSASVLQYTSFGETWYKGLTVALHKRLSHRYQLLVCTPCRRPRTRPRTSSRTSCRRTAASDAILPTGTDCRSGSIRFRARSGDSRSASPLRRVRHLRAALDACRCRESWPPDRAGLHPLAGADLNGDGNGGAFPPDRARRTRRTNRRASAGTARRPPRSSRLDLR